MRTHSLLFVGGCILLAGFAQPLYAQTSFGGLIGMQLDTEEDFLALGAEARLPAGSTPFTLNPRLIYFIQDNVTEIQIDLNALYFLDLATETNIEPFYSGGLGIDYFSFDAGTENISETNIGLNVGAGAQLDRGGNLTPYLLAQYTITNDFFNRFLVTVGLIFGSGG